MGDLLRRLNPELKRRLLHDVRRMEGP